MVDICQLCGQAVPEVRKVTLEDGRRAWACDLCRKELESRNDSGKQTSAFGLCEAERATLARMDKYHDVLKGIRDIINSIPMFPQDEADNIKHHKRVIQEIHELLEEKGI